ncbi:Golgi to ER traffic protein [Canna indica]|uniref:Golgi to ER traffic protein n=1 Tax=Canna indica TaxID=4628 RepID=A0AAQ3JTM0_9LILI|nr:Golgi to ER traffic protein [Canna indica]
MSRTRARRGELPPPQESIEKLETKVDDGNFYEAQQMYKSLSARYAAAEKYSEALDILQSGALVQLKHGQVTCGAELAVLFVDILVKGKYSYNKETLDRLRNIYENFPKIPVPQHLRDADDDDIQKLSEALTAAKVRVETCSSFLRAAIKWSLEFGAPRSGSPQLHDMLAEYMYSESPDLDMTKVSSHFVRGNDTEKFASVLVNFMGKCYPGEDDMAITRAVLMYLSQGNLRDANNLMEELRKQLEWKQLDFPNSDLIQFIQFLLRTLERDAFPLFKILRQKYKSSIDREPLFDELLDEIAEKFYGVRRRSPLQGIFGDLFKMM